jgi:hypothetical protein
MYIYTMDIYPFCDLTIEKPECTPTLIFHLLSGVTTISSGPLLATKQSTNFGANCPSNLNLASKFQTNIAKPNFNSNRANLKELASLMQGNHTASPNNSAFL